MKKIIECVPNFSEGRNRETIDAIAAAIRQTPGCTLLDVDPGKSTNRTVYTFVGDPQAVVEGALSSARVACKRIDIRILVVNLALHFPKKSGMLRSVFFQIGFQAEFQHFIFFILAVREIQLFGMLVEPFQYMLGKVPVLEARMGPFTPEGWLQAFTIRMI